ncbi:hypothetical protein B0J15DRAFT_79883 [Fusarium solani]|uniref:Splicing factor 1 helix-hairpin domain-containing protein n=1 Tax=Fusarium solani TaxID=169388 RepID=A0A9P9K7P6_FUSSL|nr:uncharacterized protein B0J15DRAFT_79883 [Fusarium solani]KAH7247050.1 hypothetical protein B0J15DRAFT_79883 [Fusarium solani]
MSWRNQGITGSNNIPLGKRRFAEEDGPDGFVDGDHDLKRGRDPEPRSEADGPRRRKKRNRWGDASENKAAGLMGLPTAILSNMTSEQLEAYTLHLRIEEISQKLRIDDVVPADGDRYVCIHASFPLFITDVAQIAFASTPVRQPRSTYQHARIPLPQAARGRTPQADREGHEDHP